MLKQSKFTKSSASSPFRRGREERSFCEAFQNSNSRLNLIYYSPYLNILGSMNSMIYQKSWASQYFNCQNNPIGRIDPTSSKANYNDFESTKQSLL